MRHLAVLFLSLLMIVGLASWVFTNTENEQIKRNGIELTELLKAEAEQDAIAFDYAVGRAQREHLPSYAEWSGVRSDTEHHRAEYADFIDDIAPHSLAKTAYRLDPAK